MAEKLKLLFLTSRPVSWVNTAFPFAAAYYATTRQIDVTLLVGTIFFLIPYNLLMYGVNDVFDYESDILNPRKGGIEGAKLTKSIHSFVVIAAFAASIPFIIFLLNNSTTAGQWVLGFVVFMVLAYSLPKLRFKEKPFLDSITSSTHFVGPLGYAFTFNNMPQSGWVILVAFFLWGMASHAFGAVQDIKSDKAAGIGSIATVIGAKHTVRFAIVLYAVSGLTLLKLGWLGLIVATLTLLYIANIWQYKSIPLGKAETTNIAWKRFIKLNLFAGFVVTMVLIYASLQ